MLNVLDTEINDEWEELITDRCQKFERLWREYYSTIPPFDKCPIEFRNAFKEFAWQLYRDSLNKSLIEELLQSAYNLGMETGLATLRATIKDKLTDELNDFHQSMKDAATSVESKIESILSDLDELK